MAGDPVDIVVVDDNEGLLSVLTEILGECGYSVRTASDGLGALSEIRERMPEMLLSDLNMPRMSGFELLSIVRRRYPRIKVVAMSGSYSGQGVPSGVAADAFYEKGATSVARLLQIVAAMKDASESRCARVSTPIWIPRWRFDAENSLSLRRVTQCQFLANRIVAEPFAEFRTWRDVLEPDVELCPLFGEATWPQPVDKYPRSVRGGRLFVDALNFNSHDRPPSIESSLNEAITTEVQDVQQLDDGIGDTYGSVNENHVLVVGSTRTRVCSLRDLRR